MLVVQASKRAVLSEVMVHPWMMSGYSTHINNYLPERPPLISPVDMSVVRCMTYYSMGTDQSLFRCLNLFASSKDYKKATQQKRRTSLASIFSTKSLPHEPLPEPYHPLISIYYLIKEHLDRERGVQVLPEAPTSQSNSLRRPSTQSTNEDKTSNIFRRLSTVLTRLRPGNTKEKIQ